MKILLLCFTSKGKGTYIRCFHFARHLVQFGHRVVILASAPHFILKTQREVLDGVEVICQPDFVGNRFRNGGLGPIDTLLRCLYVMQNKFDVVQNYDHRPAVLYPALVNKYLMGVPLLSEWTDLHGTGGSLSNRVKILQHLIGPYENFTEKGSKKIADRLVVISRWLKKKAIELGVPESKITYIPGGADIDLIYPRPKEEVRKLLGLPIDKKIIAYTAGTHYDSDLFLRTIYNIQKNRKDVVLVTTGSIFGNELKGRVYDPERVVEYGFMPYGDYTALLPAVDLFLFPFAKSTLNEGRWPNKVGDYMAAGRPTVSNPTGDMVDLFETHKIGLLASEDPEDFAAKTLTLLNNDDLLAKIGKHARQVAEKYYDWKLMTKKLERCFMEVVRDNSKKSRRK